MLNVYEMTTPHSQNITRRSYIAGDHPISGRSRGGSWRITWDNDGKLRIGQFIYLN